MFKNITFIIPTKNRSKNLDLQINYIKDWGAPIYILDGSDKLNFNIKSLAKKYKYIKYIHYPKEFKYRIKSLKGKIKTRYTMLMSDDEFFVKDSILQCIKFLDKNLDYVSCSGTAIGFKKTFSNKAIFKEIYPRLYRYQISDESPRDRIINHFSKYICSSIYGVVRLNNFNKFINEIEYASTTCTETTEVWFQASIAFSGKIMVLPNLFWFRCVSNPPVDDIQWNRSIKFFHWYNQEKFKLEKKNFKKNFCKTHKKKNISFSFSFALKYYARDLKNKSHDSFKYSHQFIKFKKIIRFFLIKMKLYRAWQKIDDISYFNFKSLILYLNRKNIRYDIKSLKKIKNIIES